MNFSLLVLALVVFALGYFGTVLSIWYANHAGLQDMPGTRSLHSTPTPRGGGQKVGPRCETRSGLAPPRGRARDPGAGLPR